jgi:hypothetical protein
LNGILFPSLSSVVQKSVRYVAYTFLSKKWIPYDLTWSHFMLDQTLLQFLEQFFFEITIYPTVAS